MTLEQFSPMLMRREIMRAREKRMVFKNFLWIPDNVEDPRTIGQSVTLPSIGAIASSSYSDGSITYASVDDQSQTLLINKQVLCPIKVTDINRIQSVKGLYPAIAQEMGYSMANYQDSDLAAGIYAGAGVTTDLSSTGVDSGNVFDALMTLKADMKVKNVNEDIPLFVDPYLSKAIASSAGFIKTNNDEIIASGQVGRMAGFIIIETNNLTTTGTYKGGNLVVNACAFTPNRSVAWVEQKGFSVEMLRDTATVSDLMRAHQIYGWKVVRADEVAHFKVKVNVETSI
ncbi:MAG: hypothetical protein RBS96_06325 [Dehalococcoidales bacterium]|jgi:hypothetical protein|nr:hypothetical protein [Dehalococcoidales bacterium]